MTHFVFKSIGVREVIDRLSVEFPYVSDSDYQLLTTFQFQYVYNQNETEAITKINIFLQKKEGKKNVDKDYSASSMIVLGQQLKTKNLLCDIFDVNWHSRAFTLPILAASSVFQFLFHSFLNFRNANDNQYSG